MPRVSKGLYSWLFRGVPALEDFADRLSHVWTCGLLFLLACIISWKQQPFNNPITCWCPVEFSDAMVAYTHTTCLTSGQLYHVDYNQPIPRFYTFFAPGVMVLYKWLPLLLCFQALLFKFPNIVMYALHGYSGMSFDKVASLTEGFQNLNMEERTLLGKQTGRYLYNWCTQLCSCLPWRLISIVWFLVKILFFVNALVQIVLVDKLLSNRDPPLDNSTSYGDTIYDNLFNMSATEWKPSPLFPRTLLCNLYIRQFNNIHRYTVQCDLPINEFNEYVYMFIWVWLLFVTVVSFLSLTVWLVLTLLPVSRQRYVSMMLSLSDVPGSSNTMGSNQLSSLIGEDGVMILKLISANSSEHLVRDVVAAMYQLAQRQTPYSYAPVAMQLAHSGAPMEATSGMTQPPDAHVTTVSPEKAVYPSLKE